MSSIEQLNNRVKSLLNELKPFFDTESNDAISNYLTHFEFEMAFEAIFIELNNLGYVPNNVDKKAMFQLGLDLQLDKEEKQVLLDNFWTIFTDYLDID